MMQETHSTRNRRKNVQSQRFDDQRVPLLPAHPGRPYLKRHSDLATLERTLIPYLYERTDFFYWAPCEMPVEDCTDGARGKEAMGDQGCDGHARSDGTEALVRETRCDTDVFEKPDPI